MRFSSLLFILFVFACTEMSAQSISNHAIGLRLGDSDGFGAEISYQKSLTRSSRLEFDMGWRDTRNYNAFKLVGLHQWVRNLDGNFNWFYGVGGGIGNVNFNEDYDTDSNGGFFLFAAGDIGIEYNFDIPLLLSVDFRPEIGIIGYDGFTDNFNFDIALGIRYQF
ncbi:hypothetical protein [Robiginitalea aurantiaca]|uniref:Outer membrane protein beta-barrel domain-containing protein n=1 Tax=Robiginitalea aurantiaca TaxID=3056915 RepID=A0ABT7WFH0_9FLAO|nr:hypothetical protein [Robiginitalea aurantiaca]MDM9631668.1 hypothetical protein [Robiginitalea aurantiaca]